MRKLAVLLSALFLVSFAALAQADDKADIEALVKEYNRLEENMDMAAQARLMTPDRIWASPAGRRTDQALNMRLQQAGMDRAKQRSPGTKAFHEVRDLIVKVYGDAAVASFYWYRNWVLPADQEGPNPSERLIQSLFLVKQDGTWKIAYSHVSPLNPSN